jgi:5-methylthioadenosine/S-adenosylhomocysteine deaminase
MRSRLMHRQLVPSLVLALAALAGAPAATAAQPTSWDPARGILIQGATVVTMDDAHTVIPHGRVLIRDGRVIAVWRGPKPPPGIQIGGASVIEAGADDLLFPGLINLHDHPLENFLHAWPPPATHAIPDQGKAGTDPYANRYQWGGGSSTTSPPELARLVSNPAAVLTDPIGLRLGGEVIKYAEVAALVGGQTSIQGAPRNAESDGILARNIDNDAFDTRIAPPRVPAIEMFDGPELAELRAGMIDGRYDAWMVHLAEGVRDGDRRPGDPVSSRTEFATLKERGLLTDMTVIIHGTGLEREDFAEMRSAPTIRADGIGDGRGAKLVWSPLSNLRLYGRTANVFDALAEGVLVNLGTDWAPSGSRTLLRELKIADVVARDSRLLGADREQIPAFSLGGKTGGARQHAETALDQALVDMVTRNPALSLRWYDMVGSIEAGKVADLLLIHRPSQSPSQDLPPSVYRYLIDATERDVELVLVGGDPLSGDVGRMSALKPGDYEVVSSLAGGFSKAIDTTASAPIPEADERLADIVADLEAGVEALGGDHPPPDGGPGPVNNTYSYLKAHVSGGQAAGWPDALFQQVLGSYVDFLPDGSLNIERVQLLPLFAADDDFSAHMLNGDVDPATGLIDDPTPPFALYPADLNHIGPLGNPFERP